MTMMTIIFIIRDFQNSIDNYLSLYTLPHRASSARFFPEAPQEALFHGTGGVLGHAILPPGLALPRTTPNTALLLMI